MKKECCYHCGDTNSVYVLFDENKFCCNGCKTVYEILNQSELTKYYDLENTPGKAPDVLQGKYDYLDSKEIINSLIEFDNETIQIVNLYIPHIHCSSCIWVLENLNKLNINIVTSQVNFPKKTVRITYNISDVSLKKIVELLCSIGYEPYISLDDSEKKNKRVDYSLLFKLVTAGFAFGNVMFLSFPEYFEINEFWLNQYKPFFHQIMLVFSIPVVVYSAQDYFISAFKGLKHRILNIDIPIALGILVLFFRSVYDITTHAGQGFLDSLCGLVFFLLLGKFFQQKTYNFLSFERDYKSYFPIAVTKINGNDENAIPVHEIKKGDRLLIRNEELIPVDAILIKGDARIDYSFVTGEAKPIKKTSGDKLFAGGKQIKGILEVEATKSISQSYLTQLWSNDVFKVNKQDQLETLTNTISKHFTIAILSITFLTGVYWYLVDTSILVNAVSAVLIVACPCALALSAPFTLGNVLRILGKQKIYLKNATVIESLAKITTVVFDKTGTLTQSKESSIEYLGKDLSEFDLKAIKSVLRISNHPLSRVLYHHILTKEICNVDEFKENIGKGITGSVSGKVIKIGSASFLGTVDSNHNQTAVYISVNEELLGKYLIKNKYRDGVLSVFENLSSQHELIVLSGDNEGEKKYLERILPRDTQLLFHQKPEDKLTYIKSLQNQGQHVLMVGDGLNDSGALAQSDVGIVISENVNVFSPACDVIIDAEQFTKIPSILKITKQSKSLIIASFILSFSYNIIGLSFAVTGNLSPIVAAILMPVSSISVVAFVSVASNIIVRKNNI
jgi:Cu+-exporting ATPase